MGAELYTCAKCGEKHFAYHSCNHKACPQCGKADTAKWVERELNKRVPGIPYYMVNFTLPAEFRPLFLGQDAKKAYDAFFTASSKALSRVLSNPKWLGASVNGFTGVLHTWNQQLLFHPHIHYVVPGAGLGFKGNGVVSKSDEFLIPVSTLRKAFVQCWKEQFKSLDWKIDSVVWRKTWGVYIKPFGSGENVIKYLGAYVCRTAIGDRRIQEILPDTIRFKWKDRSDGNKAKILTLEGGEFVARYMRHVLPLGMRSIRYYGFCHPAAAKKRERVHAACGKAGLRTGTEVETPLLIKPSTDYTCRKCGQPMEHTHRFRRDGKVQVLHPRGPPEQETILKETGTCEERFTALWQRMNRAT